MLFSHLYGSKLSKTDIKHMVIVSEIWILSESGESTAWILWNLPITVKGTAMHTNHNKDIKLICMSIPDKQSLTCKTRHWPALCHLPEVSHPLHRHDGCASTCWNLKQSTQNYISTISKGNGFDKYTMHSKTNTSVKHLILHATTTKY